MLIKIKKPKLEDLSEIIELWKKQYAFHYDLDSKYYVSNSPSLTKKFRRYLKKAIVKSQPNILVAQVKEEIIGFITFSVDSDDYLDARIKKFGHIIELFVTEEYRQQGVGKKLSQATENYFSRAGIKYLIVQSSSFNKLAINFYRQIGFVNRQVLFFKKI